MNNPLIQQATNDAGMPIYKITTFDIEVVARLTGGIAPTIAYFHKEKEVTDDIRAIRFHFENPASYIEDYNKFQSMLFEKEQRAINELYESFSIKPKNMSHGMQLMWSFFVFLLITVPLILAVFILK